MEGNKTRCFFNSVYYFDDIYYTNVFDSMKSLIVTISNTNNLFYLDRYNSYSFNLIQVQYENTDSYVTYFWS